MWSQEVAFQNYIDVENMFIIYRVFKEVKHVGLQSVSLLYSES